MLEINSLEDISALKESVDIECKLAQGKDGKGAFPKSFWQAYSAFANTEGGHIFLGLREKPNGHFELAGIKNIDKVINEFWTTFNSLENILDKLNDSRIYTKYLTGQIEADFLDADDAPDIATSDRQRVQEDDPRYDQLVIFLRKRLDQVGITLERVASTPQSGKD